MKIQEINLGDLDYPYLLSQIYCPPKKLYILGNAQILRERSIAIVGCRKASEYGKKTAKELAVELFELGFIPSTERNYTAPRLTELEKMGFVKAIDKKKCQYTCDC